MWDTIIGWHVRRSNRNLLLTNLALLAALLGFTLLNGRYLVNFILGPFQGDKQTLASLKPGQEPFDYFLTVKGQPAREPLCEETKRTVDKHTKEVRSETHVADFIIVPVGQRSLVVKVPGKMDPAQTEFTGSLAPLPGQISSSLQEHAAKMRAEAGDFIYPYMLDTTGFRGPGYWGLAIGLPFYVLAWWNIIRAIRRMGRCERHPIVQRLARYGTPAEVAQSIDAQVKDRANVLMRHGFISTPAWLLRPTTFGLDTLHVFDLVWAYKKVTKHSVNFIPTGTTSASVICTRYGQTLEVNSGNGTEGFLQHIAERAPWIIAGYSPELAGIWQKNAGALVAAVDERREKILGSTGQEPEGAAAEEAPAAGPGPENQGEG
jgi:hypothetical protein